LALHLLYNKCTINLTTGVWAKTTFGIKWFYTRHVCMRGILWALIGQFVSGIVSKCPHRPSWFLADRLLSTRPTQYISKITTLLCNFVPVSELKSNCHDPSIVAKCCQHSTGDSVSSFVYHAMDVMLRVARLRLYQLRFVFVVTQPAEQLKKLKGHWRQPGNITHWLYFLLIWGMRLLNCLTSSDETQLSPVTSVNYGTND